MCNVVADNQGSAADWRTDLVIHNDSCGKSASITFELAPPQFGFVSYQVALTYNSMLDVAEPKFPMPASILMFHDMFKFCVDKKSNCNLHCRSNLAINN
jgi:hypothetical protein